MVYYSNTLCKFSTMTNVLVKVKLVCHARSNTKRFFELFDTHESQAPKVIFRFLKKNLPYDMSLIW